MLKILTKSEFEAETASGEFIRITSKNPNMLSDISQYFRITLDDVVPGLGSFSVTFRYIPILNLFIILKPEEIISDMIPDIFRSIDSSKIFTDIDYAKKAIADNITLEQIENDDDLVFRGPSFVEIVKLQYFNMEARYKENAKWRPTQEEVYKVSWRGQNLYIRIEAFPENKEMLSFDFSEESSLIDPLDLVLIKNLLKYKYVFRRFIT